MPNYIVTYNIGREDIRRNVSVLLEKLGLINEINQSTRFGFYDNSTETIIKKLKRVKEVYPLDQNDSITLYYAELNRSKYSTITSVKIL